MNLHVHRRTIASLAFIFLSIGSTVYLSTATINYLQFYTALGQLHSNVSNLVFSPSNPQPQGPTIQAKVIVDNPTRYEGLRIIELLLQVYLVAQNASLFKDLHLIGISSYDSLLGPNASITLDLSIQLTGNEPTQITQFQAAHPGQVTAHAVLQDVISTFLDSAIGTVSTVEEQDIILR